MVYPQSVRHNRGSLHMAGTRLYQDLLGWLDTDVPPIQTTLGVGFAAGCGNSGTTLVAARLGNHPDIHVIPHETGFFRPSWRLARGRRKLVAHLAVAQAAGVRVLIEKTPKHVYASARIWRLLPEARMIVVLRNPYDTCLSLKRRFGDLDFAIERWRIDNTAALALRSDPRVTIVRYERLTEAPAAEFATILAFLGLDWDPALMDDEATEFSEVGRGTRTMRLRAQQIRAPIRANTGQWREALAPAEITQIRERTGDLWSAIGGDPDGDSWRD